MKYVHGEVKFTAGQVVILNKTEGINIYSFLKGAFRDLEQWYTLEHNTLGWYHVINYPNGDIGYFWCEEGASEAWRERRKKLLNKPKP